MSEEREYASGLFIDLRGIEFAESGLPTRLHAMPNNKSYMHPYYGKIEFTPDRIRRFADNVNNNVRGIALDIDYDHKQSHAHGTKAAGWVESAEATDDGLMLEVNFTDPAKEAIKAGEYRYFSPEFAKQWKDPATGAVHKDVLFGGGITNRPFLKDLKPYALTERIYGAEAPEGDPMTDGPAPSRWDRFLGWLGVTENSTEADFQNALREKTPEDPRIATMEERIRKQDERLAAQEVKLREAAVKSLIATFTEGSGYALPIPALEKLSEFLMECSEGQQGKLVEVFTEIKEKGLVPLREAGGNTQTDEGDTNVVSMFEKRVADLRAADPKMSYADAAAEAARALGDDAYKGYRNESFIEGRVR